MQRATERNALGWFSVAGIGAVALYAGTDPTADTYEDTTA
jgi:hypothetical protein